MENNIKTDEPSEHHQNGQVRRNTTAARAGLLVKTASCNAGQDRLKANKTKVEGMFKNKQKRATTKMIEVEQLQLDDRQSHQLSTKSPAQRRKTSFAPKDLRLQGNFQSDKPEVLVGSLSIAKHQQQSQGPCRGHRTEGSSPLISKDEFDKIKQINAKVAQRKAQERVLRQKNQSATSQNQQNVNLS